MMEKISAAVILVVCVVMLARLVLGEHRRHRFDARMLHAGHAFARHWRGALRWWSNRRYAAVAARDAIHRAREGSDVRRDGNVYRPESFRQPRKPH
jgi:hypothetical protein